MLVLLKPFCEFFYQMAQNVKFNSFEVRIILTGIARFPMLFCYWLKRSFKLQIDFPQNDCFGINTIIIQPILPAP